jgi:predicted transposase/invertase (TIGR01784 family)
VLELTKLPQVSDGSLIWDWLRFIAARSKEELKMLAEKNPQVKKAVGKLAVLNEDERARLIADSQNKLRWDIESRERDAMNSGLAKGRAEGLAEGQAKGLAEANRAIARKLLERGWSVDEIAAMTNLSRDEVLLLAQLRGA